MRVHRVNPDQPDVAGEASIAAPELGRMAEALAFCHSAIGRMIEGVLRGARPCRLHARLAPTATITAWPA